MGCPGAHAVAPLGSLTYAFGSMDARTITTWMRLADTAINAERDRLVELDAAIGDGDHGTNMARGFDAVVNALANDDCASPGQLLVRAGKTLVSTVGGASGPLWGSAFRRAGRSLGDEPTFDGTGLVAALEAAIKGVVAIGGAGVGDKTMLDVLVPTVAALREKVAAGAPLATALHEAAQAAEGGVVATVPMQARKGRASYLGERSIGHQDPGATSAALIVRALEQAVSG